MYVYIPDQAGTVLVHKNVAATPEACLRVIALYREDLVVAVECIFTWYFQNTNSQYNLPEISQKLAYQFSLRPR